MNFSEILTKRRSIRKFQEKPVPLELIKEMINDSILAPSAGNEQPWKYVIVTNQDLMDRLSTESKRNMLERIASHPDDYAKKYEKMLQKESFHIFYHAPAVVYILGDARIKNLLVDCALAASYFMISATSRGLGSCWVNFGKAIGEPELLEVLGMPENHQVVAPIALGYPEKIPGIPHRREAQILRVIE